MKTLRLKCKYSSGQCVIDSLSEESTLEDLLKAIHSRAGISDSSSVSLKTGFPPQPVDLTDMSRTILSANIRSGDTVIAEAAAAKPKPTDTRPPEPAAWTENYSDYVGSRLLTRQSVPANNSCLFTSVDFCLSRGKLDLSCAPGMRSLIVQSVREHPDRYSAAVLGMEPDAYCARIMQDDQWGGGIEVDILSRHYRMEIAVVDTQTVRIDRFGEGEQFPERILLLYDGIHYDPLALENFDLGQDGGLQTRFPTDDDAVLQMALELAREAKSSRQFTDTGKFKIKCMDCGIFLSGEKEAQEHAKSNGHANFQEV